MTRNVLCLLGPAWLVICLSEAAQGHADDVVETWFLREGRDPVSDLPTASAKLTSNDGTATLSLVCSGAVEPVVSVQYLPRKYLGSKDNIVILRFDNEPAVVSSSWEYVSKGAFNRVVPEVLALASKFAESHQIVVRAMNYENQPIDATFEAENGKMAINKVLSACQYPLVP